MDLIVTLYTKKMIQSMYYLFGKYIQTLTCTNKKQSIATSKSQFDFFFFFFYTYLSHYI